MQMTHMTMDHSNNNWRDGLARIQLCVSEIREWMNQNMLKCKEAKKIIGGITGSETIMSENKEELMTIYNYMDFF